MIRKN